MKSQKQNAGLKKGRWGHTAQDDVAAFHHRFNNPIGDRPGLQDAEFRAALILEEAIETVEAMTGWRLSRIVWKLGRPEEPDLVATIDGLCDLLYVVYGAGVTFGVDLAPFWDEVHETNMAKSGGPRREDGKILKPPGWRPPDIAGILADELDRDWELPYYYVREGNLDADV
jgi:predicted HAD superfamily Cof-like phosphohydrolase